ncbi:hypothetical protein BPAE_0157g00100 [Botrytis paeoniae]|uniref:Uncharacterized protein n=1 Tax=Botrytis paeoniae TaxID=278948 RepID=A0A4Z1FJC6_9HELO|nr:hypothetical protein BPAE_0157g00100 [Botrytis paeoniae]
MATLPCDGALKDPPNIHTSVRRRLELMQLILLPLTGALVQMWPSQRTTTGSNVSTWVKIAARSKITEVRHFKVLVQ